MQAADISTLAAWLAATDIDLLELRGPDATLRLRRHARGVQVDTVRDPPSVAGQHGSPGDPQDDAAAQADTVVRASTVGVFLHRHPLRHDELAPPGSEVAAGQVLGLLQTGALLHPVRAPKPGLLLDTLAAHGAAVGYGTPLFALSDAP